MKSKIIIVGYFGANNIGDEAILKVMLNFLKNMLPDILVRSINPELTAREFGVNCFSFYSHHPVNSIVKNIIKFAKAKYIIIGGGGLLQDVTGISLLRGNIPFIFQLFLLSRIFKIKFILYSLGVGPINTRYGKFLAKFIIKKADLVSVRANGDKVYINSLFKELSDKKIMVTGDPAFFLRLDKRVGYKSNPNIRIGLNLRPWFDKDDIRKKRTIKEIAKFLNFIVKEYKAYVIFIPFHWEQDQPFCKELERYTEKNIKLMINRLNSQEVLHFVNSLDFMIGMRLHSLIFSGIAHIPFIALSYDPKVDYFLEELNLENFNIPIEQFELAKIKEKFHYLYENRENVKNMLREKLNILKESTFKQQTIFLDRMLNL